MDVYCSTLATIGLITHMSKRVIVKVMVEVDIDGNMTPVRITWPDGRQFIVDRLLDVRPTPAKSGGAGIRYLC
jgi:hypothetical protein